MKLKNISLESFRNYSNYNLLFPDDKSLILLVGDNGEGKTNLLEAIYLLSLGKSFRSSHNDDLVKWGKEYLRCNADILTDDDEISLEVFYSKLPIRQKSFKKNGVKLKNTEFLGNLLTVLFHPEDLNMLYLSPSLRRRYLDIVLCQTDKKYLSALSQYKKVLKQRSALLHTIRKKQFEGVNTENLLSDLDAWDKELSQFGSIVITKRLNFLSFLKDNIQHFYQKISSDSSEIKVEYKSKINIEDDRPMRVIFDQALAENRKRDVFKAESSVGPHRDDLIFYINGKEIGKSASRGEFRSILLAIKLVEIKFIEDTLALRPVLLLDDVFSELDPDRQKKLLSAIQGCQTIITATDLNGLGSLEDSENSLIVKID